MILNPSSLDQNASSHETVVTPAGHLPKDRVTHVGPGLVIRRNPDGTYTTVQQQLPAKPGNKAPTAPTAPKGNDDE
jgi:hypothetical protein